METTVITTPSGHKVTIKHGLTYGESRQIKRAAAGAVRVDPRTQETSYDATVVIDAQDLAMKLLVVKVELQDGSVFEYPDERVLPAIMDMAAADGEAIFDKVDELTKPALPDPEKDKEKRGPSSSNSSSSTGTAKA